MGETKHANYKLREKAVKAVLNGQSVGVVSKCYGYVSSTMHRWVKSYKKRYDLKSLVTKPRSGRPRILQKSKTKDLKKDILKPASKFGYETYFWTARRLIQHLKKNYNIKISQPTMWRRLKEAKLTYQKPERRYYESNKKKQNEWIRKELPKIKEVAQNKKAILYFEDEASIQLMPVLGKTWAPIGKTPKQVVTGNRGSIAAMSAISSSGNLIFSLFRKKIKSTEVIQFLTQMLKHHSRRHLVVVMDRAQPHRAKIVKSFVEKQKRLRVFYLPSRSPELNPDEKVWNHLKHQELKSHGAKNLKDLKRTTNNKLQKMASNTSLVRGLFKRSDMAKLL